MSSKTNDNTSTSYVTIANDSLSVVLTDTTVDATFETLTVTQDGPPVKRVRFNEDNWDTTELTIQPVTSDGVVFDVGNVAGDSQFYIDTSIPVTRSDIPALVDSTSTEAFLVRKDGNSGDIFTVDTSTPAVTSAAKVTVPAGTVSTPGLIVGSSAGFYQPSSSQLALSLGETQAVLWTSSLETHPIANTFSSSVTFGSSLSFTSSTISTSKSVILSSSPSMSLTLYFLRLGDHVLVNWKSTSWSGGSGSLTSVGLDTIPSDFIPSNQLRINCTLLNNSTLESRVLHITALGEVLIRVQTTNTTAITTSATLYGGGGSYQM